MSVTVPSACFSKAVSFPGSTPGLTLPGDVETDRVKSCHSSKPIVNPISKITEMVLKYQELMLE